jgi:trehalose 6-phosphate phosphatase
MELLAELRADPGRAALLTDVDGTLAPIVKRPEEARVPHAATELLRELSGRFGMVGCISGRPAEEARRLVGVEGISYAGNHGLELLRPGDRAPRLDPAVRESERAAAEFVAALDGKSLTGTGLRLEDKGPIQSLHWRGAADERAAEGRAQQIAKEAERAGLEPRWGRKVLEVRPRAGGGKEAAVAALLASGEFSAAIYAGDDRTDLDAFRALRQLREAGELEAAICVGVVSPEGPSELSRDSDITVEGPKGWLVILDSLRG